MPRLRSRVRASFPAPNISLLNPRDSVGKRKGASAPFSFSIPLPSGETLLHPASSIIATISAVVFIPQDASVAWSNQAHLIGRRTVYNLTSVSSLAVALAVRGSGTGDS